MLSHKSALNQKEVIYQRVYNDMPYICSGIIKCSRGDIIRDKPPTDDLSRGIMVIKQATFYLNPFHPFWGYRYLLISTSSNCSGFRYSWAYLMCVPLCKNSLNNSISKCWSKAILYMISTATLTGLAFL